MAKEVDWIRDRRVVCLATYHRREWKPMSMRTDAYWNYSWRHPSRYQVHGFISTIRATRQSWL